jgi:RNAse (barnase) inhibitor barstar
MAKIEIDGAAIGDEASFHAAFKTACGFPDSYGATIDAWVDCMSYLRDDDNMTRFRLGEKEVLEIVLKNADAMQPDLREEMAYCIAGINERYDDYGEPPALKLTLR